MTKYPEFKWTKVQGHESYLCSFPIRDSDQPIGVIHNIHGCWYPVLIKRFGALQVQLDVVDSKEKAEKLVIKFGKGVRYRELKRLRVRADFEKRYGKPKYSRL